MDKEQKRAFAANITQRILRDIVNDTESKQDPDGSYTGVPLDGGVPKQDADDL